MSAAPERLPLAPTSSLQVHQLKSKMLLAWFELVFGLLPERPVSLQGIYAFNIVEARTRSGESGSSRMFYRFIDTQKNKDEVNLDTQQNKDEDNMDDDMSINNESKMDTSSDAVNDNKDNGPDGNDNNKDKCPDGKDNKDKCPVESFIDFNATMSSGKVTFANEQVDKASSNDIVGQTNNGYCRLKNFRKMLIRKNTNQTPIDHKQFNQIVANVKDCYDQVSVPEGLSQRERRRIRRATFMQIIDEVMEETQSRMPIGSELRNKHRIKAAILHDYNPEYDAKTVELFCGWYTNALKIWHVATNEQKQGFGNFFCYNTVMHKFSIARAAARDAAAFQTNKNPEICAKRDIAWNMMFGCNKFIE